MMWQSLNALVFLPLLGVGFVVTWYRLYRIKRVRDYITTVSRQTTMLRNFSWRRQLFKAFLWSCGMGVLFVALLRPSGAAKEEPRAYHGRDLFIALDVSRSMLVQDCQPHRLAVAKKKIRQLVDRLSCERVGLILFSGSALVQCPLTQDKKAFFMFLDHVDTETISSGTTALDQALTKALDAFDKIPERKSKLLVVFTDGEDFSSNLAQIKKRVKQQGLHISTVGVGTAEGAPVPVINAQGVLQDYQRDAQGKVVISRRNDGILHTLATDSGGSYNSCTDDDTDVRSVIRFITRFEKEKLDDKKYATIEEWYPYCIFVSLICCALEWII